MLCSVGKAGSAVSLGVSSWKGVRASRSTRTSQRPLIRPSLALQGLRTRSCRCRGVSEYAQNPSGTNAWLIACSGARRFLILERAGQEDLSAAQKQFSAKDEKRTRPTDVTDWSDASAPRRRRSSTTHTSKPRKIRFVCSSLLTGIWNQAQCFFRPENVALSIAEQLL